MAENIQEYTVDIGFDTAMEKIAKLRSAQHSINKVQEQSLNRQILLQQRLNTLQKVTSKTIKPKESKGLSDEMKVAKALAVNDKLRQKRAEDLLKLEEKRVKFRESFIQPATWTPRRLTGVSAKESAEAFGSENKKTALTKPLNDQERLVQTAIEKRQKKEQKREIDLIRLRLSKEKEIAKQRKIQASYDASVQNARIRQAVTNLISPTTGIKRSDIIGSEVKATSSFRQTQSTQSSTMQQQFAEQAKKNAQYFKEQNIALKAQQKLDRASAALKTQIGRIENRNVLFLKTKLTQQEAFYRIQIQSAILNSKSASSLREQVGNIMAKYNANKKVTNQLKRQNSLLDRMKASSKQFSGNMFSVFAVATGVTGIVRVGQDFESVNNTMLAVSDTSEVAGKNFRFIQKEAFRLGLGLKDSAKGFAKMLAAKGDMSLEDTKAAFTGISEMSTLLGLSANESSRAINALQQMMSKGVVSAEELKLQMGEALPNAIPLMAKAAQDAGLSVSGTAEEMRELQRNGQLLSSKVLPYFAKRLHSAAIANGGLEKSLNSNRVAMNRMVTSAQIAADSIFKGGLSEGLTELFKNIADFFKDNQNLWEALGNIFGSFIKGISKGIVLINHVLKAFGTVLKWVSDAMGDFAGWLVLLAGAGYIYKLIKALKALKLAFLRTAAAEAAVFAPIMMWIGLWVAGIALAIGLLEELYYFFNPDKNVKTFFGFDVNDFNKALEKIPTFFSKILEDIKSYFSDVWDSIISTAKDKFMNLFSIIRDTFMGVADGIKNTLSGIWDKLFGSTSPTGGFNNINKSQIPALAGFDMGMATPHMNLNSSLQSNNTTHITVELDGEKVAQSTVGTSTFEGAMNRSINSANGGY